MQQLTDNWETTRDGTIHIGRNTRGCKHCGHIEHKRSANGRAILHHPGTTCCRKAIEDQLEYRRAELARLRQEAAEYQAEMDAVQARASATVGKEAAEATATLHRMNQAYEQKLLRWRLQTDGGVDPLELDAPPHVGLKQEIRELEQMLQRAAA